MTTYASGLKQTPPPQRRTRRKRRIWTVLGIAVAAVAALVLAIGLAGGAFHAREGRHVPAFPSLAENPDSSLQGTVAYYADATGCIRLVAAAGQPSKTVWCLPKEGPTTWAKVGKPVGPQLVWLPDGRLEVTMFRMKTASPGGKPPDGLDPGWQKIVDVRTGTVQDLPAARAPSTPNTTTQPTVSPKGDRVGYTADQMTGRVKVVLTEATGTRTLLSVHGPGEYTYRFGPVFWAPNWQWIAATDNGRILVITTADPSSTRVLVTGTGGGAGGGTAGPAFAVTAATVLTSGG